MDLSAVVRGGAAAATGVPHGEALVAFAEALVAGEEPALARARARLRAALGPEGLVDAAAVAANFQRMVRIADATGIPLDGPMEVLSRDLRGELGLEHFGSAANTPAAGPLRRALGPLLLPLARRLMRHLAPRLARRAG